MTSRNSPTSSLSLPFSLFLSEENFSSLHLSSTQTADVMVGAAAAIFVLEVALRMKVTH